jgi:hypothetical protein
MPADAYRFARGETLGIQPYDADGRARRSVRLSRPLDFAAVTDHAELLGEVEICRTPGLTGYDSIVCRIYRRWPRLAFFLMNSRSTYVPDPTRYSFCGEDGSVCTNAARTPWHAIIAAAEGAYDRSPDCRFTTFIGYEWTGGPGSNNIHRNMIFRDEHVPELPVSYFEAPSPQRLWDALDAGCRSAGSGCDVVVIPHNSNLSGGIMFETAKDDGSPMDATSARRRALFEPLVEVIQHKGDSECFPDAGGTDELCEFEKLPYNNFRAKYVPLLGDKPHPASTIRYALGEGLRQEALTGANPFRFGLIGSTDTHLGTPGDVDERTFAGHGGAGVPAMYEIPPGLPDNLEFNPGGLAVLWAEENTRESLFAAMRRREAYATSGPRIVARFFGGWDLDDLTCADRDLAAKGYALGVPMGGVLPTPPAAAAVPSFVVSALADAGGPDGSGAPLERLQIVKGWLDDDGHPRESVLTIAGSPDDDASADTAADCDAVAPGVPSLCRVWTDETFDAARPSFYYARILEVPTCRWSQRICNERGVDCERPSTITAGLEPCCAPEHRRTIRERAWTSPIWYSPAADADDSSN